MNAPAPRITALLGPTNTGKTHLAVERLLGHSGGVIGLPLRLLAREVYDRVVKAKGKAQVALVTGEEKIVPAQPRYFVCTVESMPLERRFPFVAIDEIQLAADPERGHVFTDRLLRARGSAETILLGADTIRPLIRRLVPEAEFVGRPRFSTLAFAGHKKLSRLPRRSAIVAFSAADVYAIAELVRRQRGGAAVVLGALSPRSRNAQVAMFEAGEVDYLVATDAIGMGLNLNLDHVAFAKLSKFDGRRLRTLYAPEIAQIAGRAGRHMSDGTFGTTADAGDLRPEVVEHVEAHRFRALRSLHWRNTALDFRSLTALRASLEAPPDEGLRKILLPARLATDATALETLAKDEAIARRARDRATVRLLWEVCQIPDFRKTLAEEHAALLGRIFGHLSGPEESLPGDWVAAQVDRLDRSAGDIDTLAARIAHIRTWTYISHRQGWIRDAGHWQERTRAIEDRLSDALHERLTQRFVDHRTAVLVRRLKDREPLLGSVSAAGEVLVEGHQVGLLNGFRLILEEAHGSSLEARAVRSAALRIAGHEMAQRARRLAAAPNADITLDGKGQVLWHTAPVARLAPGREVARPALELLLGELEGNSIRPVAVRLESWLSDYLQRHLGPLYGLAKLDLSAPGRGLAFQLGENLGALPRNQVATQVSALKPAERTALRAAGLRIGAHAVFLPALLKPQAAALCCLLWAVHQGLEELPAIPSPGLVSLPIDAARPAGFYAAAGFYRYGSRSVRIDMIEKLANAVRKLARAGPVVPNHELLSLVGCQRREFAAVMRNIGYHAQGRGDDQRFVFAGQAKPRTHGRRRAPNAPESSPFAVLGQLQAKTKPS
ncbi:MAG: helicase-related protein [Alphaproteobacteria bacterium]|jgi:ATP-dependent RNA helicase SUPV3L1/SUV3|nr:helicase-related protein [Alphaproteobacteria bacterium]